MKCKIFLGMSGGVDSSVSAILLQKAGYEVHGVTLLLTPPGPQRDQSVQDAREAAELLGIPFHTVDCSRLFAGTVMDYFVQEYQNGRTPNPCVVCNPAVKFASLLAFARSQGENRIATGHYAQISRDADGVRRIRRNPTKKDQSYFLCRLTREQLQAVEFPLGAYSKEQVRALARDFALPCSEKGDSQEVCFIPDNDYGGFLTGYGGLVPVPGDFLDCRGNVLGQHRGIIYYTRGQRRGLEIALGERMYVTGLNPRDNTVTLCRESERYMQSLFVTNLSFLDGTQPPDAFEASVKIRSTAKPQACQVIRQGEVWQIQLSEKQTMAAPGQTAAFYEGDILLGGGEIV